MIDEKKIEEAAFEEYPLNSDGNIIGRNGFKEGVKWAVNELIKDLWHPASEEPKKDMLVLTDTQSIMNKGNICWMTVKLTENGFIHNWSNYVKATKITRWLYIDDLFPKKGGDGK